MPKPKDETPQHLRPYIFHGLDLRISGDKAAGDCPFCAGEGKLGVQVSTGLWRCVKCNEGTDKGGGNVYTFLRLLWERSFEARNGAAKELAEDRRLLHVDTVDRWGICRSILDGCWLVPGHNVEGKLCQLYRWDKGKDGKRILKATAGLPVQPMGHISPKKQGPIYVTEGPWDAMALWEALGMAKQTEEVLKLTANSAASLLADADVLALPGCGSFQQAWSKLLAGRPTVLCFDNDHLKPAVGGKGTRPGAGFAGVERTARLLLGADDPPASISWLCWGEAGHDPELPDGCDVRDLLGGQREPAGRVKALALVLSLVQPIPQEWADAVVKSGTASQGSRAEIEPEPCTSWAKLRDGWKKALDWRQSLDDALSVMLAVSISTEQVGDQLFLQLIGEAGSAKTRLCDGMLVSKHCFPLEHLTGFHSGWKGPDGEDYSLLARINHKTLITPEGDVLMSSPRFTEIMSQQRRIFDGTSGASYKNRKDEQRYTGLRTPWIIAGTPALMSTDQSRLGDRFLRVIVDPPDEEGKRGILRRVGYTALRSVMQRSNCRQDSIVEENLLHAYRLTGGYVDHLRANVEELLAKVECDEERLVDRCSDLAEFVAFLRARPDPDKRKDETHDAKELPTRLTHQLVRLAVCLAAVLNRPVDAEVMRRVQKVALDTAKGSALNVARVLWKLPQGASAENVATQTARIKDKESALLEFMGRIGAVEKRRVKVGGTKKTLWTLSPKLQGLWRNLMGDDDAEGS